MDIGKGTPFYTGYMALYGVMKDGFASDFKQRKSDNEFWDNQMKRVRDIARGDFKENELLVKIILGYLDVLEKSVKDKFTLTEKELQATWLAFRNVLWEIFDDKTDRGVIDEKLKGFAGTNTLAKTWVKEVVPILYDYFMVRDREKNIEKLVREYCA